MTGTYEARSLRLKLEQTNQELEIFKKQNKQMKQRLHQLQQADKQRANLTKEEQGKNYAIVLRNQGAKYQVQELKKQVKTLSETNQELSSKMEEMRRKDTHLVKLVSSNSAVQHLQKTVMLALGPALYSGSKSELKDEQR